MPSRERVKWAQLRTGIIAVSAMIVAAALIFLLTSQTSVFQGQFQLRTYMADSAGMAANAPIRLNGIPVGHIKNIRLSGSRDPNRTVEITLEIEDKYLDQI